MRKLSQLLTHQVPAPGQLPLIPPGVTLCSAVGVHDIAVSEWTLAAILAMRHRLPEFLALQARGVWDAEVSPESRAAPTRC